MVVGADNIVYECWDLEYCSWSPDSDLGFYGWDESIFTIEDIPAYDAETNADLATCAATKHYVITDGMVTLPYRTGDVLVYGMDSNGITDAATCFSGELCRISDYAAYGIDATSMVGANEALFGANTATGYETLTGYSASFSNAGVLNIVDATTSVWWNWFADVDEAYSTDYLGGLTPAQELSNGVDCDVAFKWCSSYVDDTYGGDNDGWNKIDIGVDGTDADAIVAAFGRECMAFDPNADYEQWEVACQELTHSGVCSEDPITDCTAGYTVLAYECHAEGGCPTDADNSAGIFYDLGADDAGIAQWGVRAGWHLTRSLGQLVTEYTAVDAWLYTDYAYAIAGDVVYVGESE